ncbi:putative bifunctional diguanylate cyclase/phosphodiesterase [Novosphingobium sp.]|uniref:putative bifunctional diguanylate cyclase/phosphodiesterase n=1 Tax=Novosphingobium sp. TaxID=1874826 RepID=UPI002FDCB9A3
MALVVLLEFENRILRLIADGAALDETADELSREVEAILPGVRCTIVSVDRAGLLRTLAPRVADECGDISGGVMIGPDVGSCGAAAYRRVPVLVTDIANDPKWRKYADLAVQAGFKACWSSPVMGVDGEAIGALAVYFQDCRGPTEREEAIIATCVDLCGMALRRHERVLERERRATVDALTGLPNRTAFHAAVRSLSCDQPGAWALLIVDLDNLKTVNDTFGHQAGDALIRVAGARIAAAVAPDIMFRIGGDEFTVIVQRADALSDLDAFATRIFSALEMPADYDGHAIVPAATIGGAVLAAGSASAEAVYREADFALYHAKETGRGGFVRYWPGLGTRIVQRQAAIRNVTAALAEERIDAFYQPVVCLNTRKIVGAEALCRLRMPSGEILPAAAFQEATSDARVAAEMTERMLSLVAQDVRCWLDAGIPLQHVGVNVSTADFYTGDLLGKLERSFGRLGVSLDHVIIEVKEDAPTGGRDNVVAREIKRLRDRGVCVALDNFGTGQASLTSLLSVPVDIIKIDGSFIARLWPGDPSMVIVPGLIDMAKQLDVRIVAEGIETEVQASQLWTMGCMLGQGFAFSQAVDRMEMTDLFHRHAQWTTSAVPLFADRRARPGPAPGDGSAILLTGTG